MLPKRRQSLFFSATMPHEIEILANSILTSPEKVEVTPASSTVDKIEQYLYYVEGNKPELLIDLLGNPAMESVLVFTRTKHGADKVVKFLAKANITAEAIHGNKGQNARQRALANFKDRTTRVLIATDIAARGIDVDDLSHVVNYELPNVPETYVHRIGRTGRAGRTGVAYSFCSVDEVPLLRDIEKLIDRSIEIAGGNAFDTREVREAVAQKKADLKEKIKERNMYGSRRDGSFWRNKKRAQAQENTSSSSSESRTKGEKSAKSQSAKPHSPKPQQRSGRPTRGGSPSRHSSSRSSYSRGRRSR